MFRKLTSISLLLVFVLQTFNKPFIVLDYFANTAAYAKNCVNKARPAMHCNGKCQMMQKLREQEKKEKQEADRKAENKTELVSSKSFDTMLSSIESTAIIITYNITAEQETVDMPRSFFHPPAA